MTQAVFAKIFSSLLYIAQILLLAACYFVAGEASFSLSVSHHIVTLVVFAAEGFALAAVILVGFRIVPGIFLGQLLLALNNNLTIELAIGISIINSLEAVIGAFLFQYFRLEPELKRLRDVSSLLLLILLVLQPFSASFGCLLLWFGGVLETSALKSSWFYWWFGNAMGQILVTPVLLSFFRNPESLTQRFYTVFLTLGLVIPTALVVLMPNSENMILAFSVATPLLILIAIHLGMNAATLATAIFALIALLYTRDGHGVFVVENQPLLLNLNTFLLGMALCSLFIAVLFDERKRMLAAYRASEQRFIDMVNTSDGIVWEADAKTYNFTFVSSKAERLLGYSVNDWYQPGFWQQHLHPDDKEWATEYYALYTEQLRHHDFEYRFLAKNGRTVWLRDIVSVVIENGQPRWLRGLMVDVSAKKQAERALQESEQRFRSIFEQAPIGVVNVSLEGDFLKVNQYFCKMLGYNREELLKMNIQDITHPDYYFAGKMEMQAMLAGKINDSRIEKQYICKDFRIIWGCLSICVCRHADNSPNYFIGTLQDITLQKQDAERVRLSQAYGGIGIWEADLRHNTQTWSNEVYDILDFPKIKTPSWEDFLNLVHPADRQTVINTTQAHILYKKKYDVEYRVNTLNRGIRWMRSVGRAERDAQGRPSVFRGIVQDITQQKQMEQALRESEQKFRTMINSSPVPMVLNDENQNITLLNSSFIKIFGYTQQDIPTLSEWGAKAYPEEQYRQWIRGAWRKHLETAIQENTEFEAMEINICCKNGEYKTVLANATPLKKAFADEYLVVLYDITERKKNEERIKLSQAYGEIVTWEANLLTQQQTWSEEAFTLFKFPRLNNPTWEDFLAVIYPDDRQKVIEKTQAHFLHNEPYDIAYRIVNTDKELRWIRSAGRVERDINGKAVYFRGIAQDITQRKQAEEALAESKAYFEALVSICPVGVFQTDAQGRCLYVNSRWSQITGLSLEQARDDDWTQALHPDDRDEVFNEWQRSALEKRPFSLEYRFVNQEGQESWVLGQSVAMLSDNEVTGYIGTITDITESKYLEQELQRSNTDLEQFAYAISHDMRQPLRMVSSYLALIEKALAEKLDSETQKFLGFAMDGAKRMDGMILGLLDFSRIGRKTEAIKPMSMQKALDEALAFLAPEINQTHAKIIIKGQWIELVASRDEITRLLQNLIGNALKYHRANIPPEVTISTHIKNGCFYVTIADNGIGIEPKQTERLFKVFSRLHTQSQYQGTGVGLALCRRIVEHHDGKIWLESKGENQGSKFKFFIPIKKNTVKE